MKLRSSIAAKYAGVAMVMCLMPVVPVVADAQTTYEQQQSTEQNNTSNIQVSYVEKVSDIVAAGYETVYETNFAGAQDYAAEAVALTDSYIEVKAGADEDAETVGRLYDYSLVYVDETGTECSGNCLILNCVGLKATAEEIPASSIKFKASNTFS